MSREKTNPPEYEMELKLPAVRRVLAGESVREVAQQLGIRRKRLYVWKESRCPLPNTEPVHPQPIPGHKNLEGTGTFLDFD